MKLEEEIKQAKFKNEYHKLLVNIIFTGNWINIRSTKFLRKYKLTPQQFNLLRILRGQHPNAATVHLLQDRMLDRMSNASRLVEKLRIKGLVDRITNCEDRRRVDVTITDKGLNLLKEIDQTDFDGNFPSISVEEALVLNNLLDKLRN